MLPFHSIVIDGSGCPIRDYISHPQACRANTVSPNGKELEVIGVFKKQMPSPLSFPVEGLDMHGMVNLEATCQRWRSQRMEGEEVSRSLLG